MQVSKLSSVALALLGCPVAGIAYGFPVWPFAPAAGEEGSTAVGHDDPRILAWATGVTEVVHGSEVADESAYRNPQAAIGPSRGTSSSVVVLGRGGWITLEFDPAIIDWEGFDFAVFENGFSDTFLELAHVEVSSDGDNFLRLPGYSYTATTVGQFGTVDPRDVHGLAGKYRGGFGTPFDLAAARVAYESFQDGYSGFSAAYASHLLEKYPLVDLQDIRYVRLVDIVGDGTSSDCQGAAIYDPYPTVITAGFDLDAIGVMNAAGPVAVPFAQWAQDKGLAGVVEVDADGDHWSDFFEYMIGTNPVDRESHPVMKLRSDAAEQLELVFTRSATAEGTLILEESLNGSDWVPVLEGIANPVPLRRVEWIGEQAVVSEKIPIPGGRTVFYRLLAIPK